MRNRDRDREYFPDPDFNTWLDEPIAHNEITVWHATQNVASAWSAWQARPHYGPMPVAGEVVATKDEAGQIVAVTRQDSEGKILSIIAESAPRYTVPPGTPAGPDRWHAAPPEQDDLFAGARYSAGPWRPTRGTTLASDKFGAWVPWYKAKQAVATAFVRHRADVAELRDEIDEMKRQVEHFHRVEDILRHERDQARSSYDRVIKIFVGIYSFIQPAPFPSSDGKTYEFVPPPELLLETWRALSKRIRDLPEQLARAV